ncbi:MAG: cation transporter [Oscillospiraceae bacterium]|nr:cation transporter [Oscillospiraceae bacterium]MBQ6493368.1 cation transporter [Erysipelotrichaceae bacterium]
MDNNTNNRSAGIIKYNLLGIAMNLLLAVMKITTGLMINAHAVILDGINSFSDMASSAVAIMSARLAGKRSNSSHPFGFGRIEYLSSFVVTMAIMYVGFTTIIDTIKAIIHPHEAPSYNTAVIIIMIISLIMKLAYGILMRKKGKELSSEAMIMTGTDSACDSLFSVAILVAIVIYKMTGVDIEHYLCIFTSLMIIYTGIGIIRECTTKMLGSRIDPEDRKRIISMIAGYDEVLNVSNLVLHNYGEGNLIGSVDIEVDDEMTAAEISSLSRRIINKAEKMGVVITSVGISGTDLSDPETIRMSDLIVERAIKYKSIKRISAFTIDLKNKIISFYIVPDYSVKERETDIEAFRQELQKCFPAYHIYIQKGIDV